MDPLQRQQQQTRNVSPNRTVAGNKCCHNTAIATDQRQRCNCGCIRPRRRFCDDMCGNVLQQPHPACAEGVYGCCSRLPVSTTGSSSRTAAGSASCACVPLPTAVQHARCAFDWRQRGCKFDIAGSCSHRESLIVVSILKKETTFPMAMAMAAVLPSKVKQQPATLSLLALQCLLRAQIMLT